MPGETQAPGSATGKTGSPIAQTAGSTIVGGIVVNAVDANWNVVSSAAPNVSISSSDPNAAIADDNGANSGNMTLASGTRTLSTLTFKTTGNQSVTATDAAGLPTASTRGHLSVRGGAVSKVQIPGPGGTTSPRRRPRQNGKPAPP